MRNRKKIRNQQKVKVPSAAPVIFNKGYIRIDERGHKDMKPRPFLKPAMETAMKKIFKKKKGDERMFENKKEKLTIFLTGDFHLKKGEVSTIILEFGDMGVIKKVEVDGKERKFIESRDLYIKEEE